MHFNEVGINRGKFLTTYIFLCERQFYMISQYSVNEKITTKCLGYKQYFLDRKKNYVSRVKIHFKDNILKYFYHMYNAETK